MASYTINEIYTKPDGDNQREYILFTINFGDRTEQLKITHEPFTTDKDRQAFVTDYVSNYETDLTKPAAETNEGTTPVTSSLIDTSIEV